nr:hypothetical protein CcurKRNrm1_p099 [Cryptomonas curvata]
MINECMLFRPLKINFLNGFLKFINKKNFLIYTKNVIIIYGTKKKYFNIPVLIKKKKIRINSDIVFLTLSSTTGFLYIYDLNHNFRIYSLYSYEKIRTFFLDLNIIFLQRSTLTKHIVYAIHTNYVKSEFPLVPLKKIYLAIINLNECKYVNIIALKNLWFNENSIKFIKKEKIIVIIDGDQINILNFNWNYKKVYKKIIYNQIEICSTVSNLNSLIIGDRNGFLNLFRFSFKNFCQKNHKALNLYSITRTKTWKFNESFVLFLFLRKSELFVNLIGSTEIIHLNYKSQKKKKLKILHCKKIFILNIIIINQFDRFLILCPGNLIFFAKNIFKSKIFDIRSLNLIDFFIKQASSILLKKRFNIRLFPLISLSNCFFLLTGPSNSFQLINFSPNLLKLNSLTKDCLKNEIYSIETSFRLLESDALGKTIFFLKNIDFFSNLFKFEANLKRLKFIQHFNLKFKYIHFPKKQFQFCIDRKGEKIAAKLNNFYIKILNINLFKYKKKKSLNFTLFSNKKVTSISMSDNGGLLALGFSNIVTFWKLFPEIKKFKTFSLNIKSLVHILKFLSLYAKEKIIICSSVEILLFNIRTFLPVWKFKFKIMELIIDKWSDLFMIKTKYISTRVQKITETIIIFNSFSPIPLKTLNPMIFFKKSILSFSFSYFSNSKNKKSFIFLDSYFTFNKIFF